MQSHRRAPASTRGKREAIATGGVQAPRTRRGAAHARARLRARPRARAQLRHAGAVELRARRARHLRRRRRREACTSTSISTRVPARTLANPIARKVLEYPFVLVPLQVLW